MQKSCVVRTFARAAMLGLAVTACASAGDLNPPPGEIAPTMKSLDRLEPRRCINDLPAAADAVHVISQGGQYFLAADVTGKFNAHGILVTTTEDVSIDLNGFSLKGVPGSLDGIHIDGGGGGGGAGGMRAGISTSRSNIPRGRGAITSWGGDGIDASNCDTVACSNLDILDCSGHAIVCIETKHIIHRDIAARNILLDGLRVADLGTGSFGKVYRGFSGCTIEACGGNGITVETNLDNAEITIESSSVRACTGDGVSALHVAPGGGGVPTSAGVVNLKDVTVNGNNGTGIRIAFAPNTRLSCQCTHLRCVGNGGDGMACVSTNPATPHDGALWSITDSDFTSNGGNGLRSENPMYVATTTMGSNALHGSRFSSHDATVMAVTMESCTSMRNAAGGSDAPKGRFIGIACNFTDEGGNGVTLGEGCLVITDCTFHRCNGNGVEVHGTINAQDCAFRRNTGYGMRGWQGSMVAVKCSMELNGDSGVGGGATFTDCTTVTLEACVFNDNTGNGVTCASSIGPVRWMAPECIASRNTGHGFDLNNCDGGQLIECKASGNGGRGIFCRPGFTNGTIERCNSTADQGGIHVAGTGNLIRACTATSSPLGGFAFAQGNDAAPIIDPAGLAASCSPHANILH